MGPAMLPQELQRYLKIYLVDSVFPAPLSPLTIIDWDCLVTFISRNALSAATDNNMLHINRKVQSSGFAKKTNLLQKHAAARSLTISPGTAWSCPRSTDRGFPRTGSLLSTCWLCRSTRKYLNFSFRFLMAWPKWEIIQILGTSDSHKFVDVHNGGEYYEGE